MLFNYNDFIKESLVLENRKTAKERYKKGFGKFDSEQFELLMSSLPLDKKGEPKTLYADYIVNWFIQDNTIDLDEVKSLLSSYNEYLYRTEGVAIFKLKEVKTFDIFKEKTKDIIQEINNKTGSGDTIIFEDNDYIVYEIKNQSQAVRLGEATPWCVTIENGLYYDNYTVKGNEYFFLFAMNKHALSEVENVKSGEDDSNNTYYNKEMLEFAKTRKGTQFNSEITEKQKYSMVALLLNKNDLSLNIKDGITGWDNKIISPTEYNNACPYLVNKIYSYYTKNSKESIYVKGHHNMNISELKDTFSDSSFFTKNKEVQFNEYCKFVVKSIGKEAKINKNKNNEDYLDSGIYSTSEINSNPSDITDIIMTSGSAIGGTWNFGTIDGGTLEEVTWSGSGKWVDGNFFDGIWKDGTWDYGTFEDSIWENGTCKHGKFKNSTWKTGTWEDGVFLKSVWESGIWKDGALKKSEWISGNWYDGSFDVGTWRDGIWKKGDWYEGTWKNGTWENGDFDEGTWENGVWKNGIWRNGKWLNGTWENGTWKSKEIHPNER